MKYWNLGYRVSTLYQWPVDIFLALNRTSICEHQYEKKSEFERKGMVHIFHILCSVHTAPVVPITTSR